MAILFEFRMTHAEGAVEPFTVCKSMGIAIAEGIRVITKEYRVVNASEQTKNIELAGKIAVVISLMCCEFPELWVDLSPWLDNPDTRRFANPDSIDLGFHFLGRNYPCQSRSLLMQIQLLNVDTRLNPQSSDVGIELSGYDDRKQQWHFATIETTIENKRFTGIALPIAATQTKFRKICQQIIQLFKSPN